MIEVSAELSDTSPPTARRPLRPLTRGFRRHSNKKSTLKDWFASLGEQIVEVGVDGETRYLLAELEDELAAVHASA